jgi:hypothetical protein
MNEYISAGILELIHVRKARRMDVKIMYLCIGYNSIKNQKETTSHMNHPTPMRKQNHQHHIVYIVSPAGA